MYIYIDIFTNLNKNCKENVWGTMYTGIAPIRLGMDG